MLMETSFSESDKAFDTGYNEDSQDFAADFVEVNEVKVTIQSYTAGDHIKITDKGVISVLTTDKAEADNTRPISSAGVAAQIGNINALLETI